MSPVAALLARLLLLPVFIIAAALLVKGADHVGDGFTAGVLAGAGVLLQYVVFGHRAAAERLHIAPVGRRTGLVGLLLIFAAAAARLPAGAPLVSHWPAPGAPVSTVLGVDVHTAVLFDAGVGLLVFGMLVGVMELFAAPEEGE